MSNLTQEVQWQSVDEPRTANRFYLVCINGHTYFYTLIWDGRQWKYNNGDVLDNQGDVTHWMKLPKSAIPDDAEG